MEKVAEHRMRFFKEFNHFNKSIWTHFTTNLQVIKINIYFTILNFRMTIPLLGLFIFSRLINFKKYFRKMRIRAELHNKIRMVIIGHYHF